MTTDPPPSEFEDVRIDNWETRLPSAICTNKEIFNEIFSLDTWKSVLQPEQRDRILKLLPPEIVKVPGAAEKTIEDLFAKTLVNFGANPLDTLFDKLINGHYDPEVVETKDNIVREWRRESLRLKKHYHTKLLQDIVISRENHLRELVSQNTPNNKKNGRKVNSAANSSATKKNGKPSTIVTFTSASNGAATTNGVTSGGGTKGNKSNQTLKLDNGGSLAVNIPTNRNAKVNEQGRNKRGRLETALLSPPSGETASPDGPSTKRAKQAPKGKTSKKAKEQQQIIVVTTSQQSPLPSSSSSQLLSSSSVGNGTNQKTSLLLGSLTGGANDLSTLSLRSPLGSAPPTSLLESLTSPINPPHQTIAFNGSDHLSSAALGKSYSKIFTSPVVPSSPASSSQSPSYLPSPVQSSPILASQLQAPSPISINLSSITGIGSISSRSGGGTSSPSHSSITLNYTQAPLAPPPSTITTKNQTKGILDDESSSDEFEFETIEPTIGFGGPPVITTSSGGTLNSIVSNTVQSLKGVGTITTQELASIQKCSLLTNCLTQPLPPSSTSTAAVSAALANNILTSPVTQAGGVHQIQIQQQPQKVIVTSGGIVATSSGIVSQQLQKFLSTPSHTGAQKGITQQQLGILQQQQRHIVCSSSGQPTAVDAQTLVNSIMASSKDLLATFGASITSAGGNPSTLLQHIQQPQTSSGVLPISVNLQTGGLQQNQIKQATIVRASPSLGTAGLLQTQVQAVETQLVNLPQSQPSLVIGQSSTLNTQSLQLPSSILSNGSGNANTKLTTSSISSIPNLLDSDDLNNLNLGSFSLGSLAGMNLDMGGVTLPDMDTGGTSVGGVDSIKLEMDCAIDKMDDLSGVLDGNPFDSIPNLSDELDGLDLDMVDGLCDFEVLLSDEKQYASFFSLIRDVLCSTRDHRMTLVCLEKTIRKWQISPGAGINPWYMRVQDWNSALIIALNFLAGNYQDVHPEDFVPYIEYKYKTKYYQWIGAGRDGDNNLTPLYTLWMDNLDRLPPLKKSEGDGEEVEEEEEDNEDSDTAGGGDSDAKKKTKRPQTPPPPRCTTDWTVRSSTVEEKEEFRQQEKSRYDNPHKAFTYRMHGYESVVGPVKGVYSSQTGVTNKARGHSLLVDDRPPYVTILALVRDAVARLPNGEGTRSEICEMLRDSAFLAPEASNVTLNSVVSGALDRLHYERDPCVRYDSHKKSWIYLHRDRTQEQFERLHHNRSYTKSTKSRTSTNRKSRKGSSKSSSSSVSSISAVTINPPQSSSSSSSQSSISTSESIIPISTGGSSSGVSTTVSAIVGVGSGAGGVVSTTSGGSLVTLPPLTTINPKMSTISAGGSTVTGAVQSSKQAVGLVSVTNAGISQQGTATIQQQALGNRGIVTLTGGQDGQQQTSATPLLNEVLAAAAGLRFQTGSSGGTPVLINQNMLGQQQGKQAFIQDASGQTSARLVLQQHTQQQAQVQSQSTSLQLHQQQTIPSGSQSAANIGPGQILLGPSAAVLKLAGNLRLGEGLRLAQLRLPAGGSTGTPGASLTTAGSPLRLPQHRILLARGSLPGQPQTQGVLLGQTSTGQTVILSAGPAGASSLAGLQSLANAGSGQITLHNAVDSSGNFQHNLQSFGGNQTTKFGIITTTTSTSIQGTPVTYSNTARTQQVIPVQGSTLPPTSIALPPSILAPTSSATGAGLQSNNPSTNINISTGHLPQQNQQQNQVILTGAPGQLQTQSSTQIASGGTTGTVQLQSSTQGVQHQNVMLTSPPPSQGQNQQGQAHHQLTAPIIIRSAQGDFVSFGIPSHLSLGRGVQGIKVIPFQSGKQTVLARIVPPPSQGGVSTSTGGGASAPGTTIVQSGNNGNIIVTSSGSGFASGINSATAAALVSGLQMPVPQQSQLTTASGNNVTVTTTTSVNSTSAS